MEIGAQKTFQPKATQIDWKGIVYYKTDYYHLSIGYLKDPREKRQNRNLPSFGPFGRSSSFTYGKQNSVINIRGGIGKKRFISEKAKRKGIAIGYDYNIGPSLAILKPYQLELIYELDDGVRVVRTEAYNEENAEKFLTYNDIFGGAAISPTFLTFM